jgi:hypothetical protein
MKMTNHPNRSKARYFAICMRGFANEITYIRIRSDEQAAIIEREYDTLSDDTPGAWAGWSDDLRARIPGVAIEFEDRNWI